MCSRSRVERLDRHRQGRPRSYPRPHWFVKWNLGAIIFSNLAVMVLSGFFINANYRLDGYGKYKNFVAILISCAIPFVALLISIAQCIQSGVGRLGVVSVVVTGVFCTLIWVVYACEGMLTGFNEYNWWWPWMALAPSGFFLNIAYLSMGADAIRMHKKRRNDVEMDQTAACMAGHQSLDAVEGKPPSYAESEVTIFPVEEKTAMDL